MTVVREFINLIGWDVDQAAFQNAENSVQGMLDKLENFGQKATLFFTVPFVTAAALMVKAASDAEETQNKFDAVFSGMADEANNWAESYSDSLDRADTATKDSLSIFQSLFIGLRANSDAAFDFSKRIVTAADDLSSFANKDPADVQQRFLSAMTGSTESVDQFGINLKVAALEQKALDLGITKSVKSMSELEKATLRLQIIEDTLGRQGATGDAIKTMAQFANRLRSAKDMVLKTAVAFGQILLPVALKLVDAFVMMNKFLQEKLTKEMKIVILVIGALFAVVGPLVLAFALLAKIGFFVQGALAAVSVAASAANVTITALLIKFALIGAAVLIVIGIIALLAEDLFQFVKGNESFIGQFIEPWETLGPKIMAALRPFLILLSDLWENVKSILMSVVDFITGIFSDDIDKATNAIENIIKQSIDGLLNILAIMLPIIWILIKTIMTQIIARLPALMLLLSKALLNAVFAIVGAIRNVVMSALNDLWNTVLSFFGDLIKKIATFGILGGDLNANINGPGQQAVGNRQNIADQLQGGSTNNNSSSTVSNENTFNIPLSVNVPAGTTPEETQALATNVRGMVKTAFETQINDLAFNTGATQ